MRALQAVRRRYLPATPATVRFVRFFSRCRSYLFGFLFGLFSNGITIFTTDGSARSLGQKLELPAGKLIIVANHRSHADSAALLAAVGRQRPVLVVADADYWLADVPTELIARTLIGIWPIRRAKEHAWADLELAAELVNAGIALVIFPEGTRSRDGQLGQIRSGAARLAQVTGASLLPVAVAGTENLFPVEGERLKRETVNLRLGDAFEVAADMSGTAPTNIEAAGERMREHFIGAAKKPIEARPGRSYLRANKIALSWVGVAVVFLWALGEGTVWPLIAEMPLLLLIGSSGKSWKALWLLAGSALGSAAGILLSWYLVSHGTNFWMPLTTEPMYAYAHQQLAADPNGAFWGQMWNGIPVKVYAHEAATLHLSFAQVLQAAVPRIARVFIVGGIGWVGGVAFKRFIQPCLGIVQPVSLVLFPLGLAMAIAYWSVPR